MRDFWRWGIALLERNCVEEGEIVPATYWSRLAVKTGISRDKHAEVLARALDLLKEAKPHLQGKVYEEVRSFLRLYG